VCKTYTYREEKESAVEGRVCMCTQKVNRGDNMERGRGGKRNIREGVEYVGGGGRNLKYITHDGVWGGFNLQTEGGNKVDRRTIVKEGDDGDQEDTKEGGRKRSRNEVGRPGMRVI
jgi:hypothetical protein